MNLAQHLPMHYASILLWPIMLFIMLAYFMQAYASPTAQLNHLTQK